MRNRVPAYFTNSITKLSFTSPKTQVFIMKALYYSGLSGLGRPNGMAYGYGAGGQERWNSNVEHLLHAEWDLGFQQQWRCPEP